MGWGYFCCLYFFVFFSESLVFINVRVWKRRGSIKDLGIVEIMILVYKYWERGVERSYRSGEGIY